MKVLATVEQNLMSMGQVDRAYFLREAGISAAQMTKLSEASRLFTRARECALEVEGEMRPMAIGLLADRAVVEFKGGNRDEALTLMAEALREGEQLDLDKGMREKWCTAILAHTIVWFHSQTKPELPWNGRMTISFGCCSNPEPPGEIKRLPEPSMLLSWYNLAALELELKIGRGIVAELRSRTTDGVFAGLEFDLARQTISNAIEDSNIDLFVRTLGRYVTTSAYVAHNKHALSEEDPLHPSLHKMPVVSSIDWSNDEYLSSAKHAVLAFASNVLTTYHRDLLAGLVGALNTDGTGHILSCILDRFVDRVVVREDWLNAIAAWLAIVTDEKETLTPIDLFVATCSLWNWLTVSPSGGILENDLANVLATRWQSLIERQRFGLNHPRLTVPVIEVALRSAKAGRVKIAQIALAAEDAVDRMVSSEVRKLLQDCVNS